MSKKIVILVSVVVVLIVMLLHFYLPQRYGANGLFLEKQEQKIVVKSPSASINNHELVNQVSAKARPKLSSPAVAVSSFGDIPLADDPEWLQDARLQDIKRSTNEDSLMLVSILSLSESQREQIAEKLEGFRLDTENTRITEYDLITSVLTPEQIMIYESYLVEKRRSDAKLFASARLHSIERVTGPLSVSQSDAICQAIASSVVNEEVVSDADILKTYLTESQFSLWSKSSDVSPVSIDANR